jgi:uncharacterized membrane protein
MESGVPPQKAYWRKSVTITWLALFAWVVVTVLIGVHAGNARDLTVVYALLTGCYAWYMSRQDRIDRR